MQLIDVTNSYARVISQELLQSSAHFIKVYTLGNSKVVYKKKRDTAEIVISNKVRPITDKEVNFVTDKLLGDKASEANITNEKKLVEISIEH
ncbi:MAG TPA: DUF1827 family protein [Candidatus Ligilactobacillus excrementigallinarum]|uniref:DUF1827 family protein n=1 Tax=Candidatus Ligilactobacillus excrementigallinarum TaxID=2838641 RepID=A0A9D2AA88_9LACO|nr:DUF1827 family protein [Candidatus Ligilactobacillus excrementigallinarum]